MSLVSDINSLSLYFYYQRMLSEDSEWRRIDAVFKSKFMDILTNKKSTDNAEVVNISSFKGAGFDPCIFLEENSKEYILSMNVPQCKSMDIDITVKMNMLNISSAKDTSHIDKVISLGNRSKYEFHALHRSFALPSDADANAAYATFLNGTLMIYFPRNRRAPKLPFLRISVR